MLQYLMHSLPGHLPFWLVYLIGAVISLVFMQKHGKAATFALLGCLLSLVVSVLFLFVRYFVFYGPMADDYEERAGLSNIINILSSLLEAAGFALVLTGVFVGRQSAPPERDRYRSDRDYDRPRSDPDRPFESPPPTGDPERDRGIQRP